MSKFVKFLFCFCLGVMITLTPTSLRGQVLVGYVASTGIVSLSGAGTAATLQQPLSSSITIGFPLGFPKAYAGGMAYAGASVYCSVACTVSIIRNSVAPTATAGSVVKLNANDPNPAVSFYTASNYSGGTTVVAAIPIGAGSWQPIDLSLFNLPRNGDTANLTIAVGSITGNVIITFYPVEQH